MFGETYRLPSGRQAAAPPPPSYAGPCVYCDSPILAMQDARTVVEDGTFGRAHRFCGRGDK